MPHPPFAERGPCADPFADALSVECEPEVPEGSIPIAEKFTTSVSRHVLRPESGRWVRSWYSVSARVVIFHFSDNLCPVCVSKTALSTTFQDLHDLPEREFEGQVSGS